MSDELQLAGPYCRINPNRIFRTMCYECLNSLSFDAVRLFSVLSWAHGKSHEHEANCLFTNFFLVYYYIHTLYNFIARGGAGVYPMRIVHHICVLDKPRNIRYIKWKSGQEVLDILGVHLAEDTFSQLNG